MSRSRTPELTFCGSLRSSAFATYSLVDGFVTSVKFRSRHPWQGVNPSKNAVASMWAWQSSVSGPEVGLAKCGHPGHSGSAFAVYLPVRGAVDRHLVKCPCWVRSLRACPPLSIENRERAG
jgi:hypothetical protein